MKNENAGPSGGAAKIALPPRRCSIGSVGGIEHEKICRARRSRIQGIGKDVQRY
jgi:hypothetical protein